MMINPQVQCTDTAISLRFDQQEIEHICIKA
jgi:hypothetical protein